MENCLALSTKFLKYDSPHMLFLCIQNKCMQMSTKNKVQETSHHHYSKSPNWKYLKSLSTIETINYHLNAILTSMRANKQYCYMKQHGPISLCWRKPDKVYKMCKFQKHRKSQKVFFGKRKGNIWLTGKNLAEGYERDFWCGIDILSLHMVVIQMWSFCGVQSL